MAAEEPSEGEIKGGRSDDQGGKNEKLHKEARVQREGGVVIPEPAGHTHNPGAQGNLRTGTEYIQGSKRTIAETENNKKREEIKESSQGRGQRGTAVLDALEEKLQKDDVQNDIQNKRDGSNDNRRLGVPRGIKRRNNQLDRGQGRKPDGVIEKSAGRQASGFRDELAVLEKHADDRFAQDHQTESRRNGDEGHDANGKRQRFLERLKILRGRLVRHHRQNSRGDGNGVAAQHQLHDPVGNVKRGEASAGHASGGGEPSVDQEIDLPDADTKKPRDHQASHVSEGGMGKRDAETELHAPPDQGRHLNQELQDTSYQNTNRKRLGGVSYIVPNCAD